MIEPRKTAFRKINPAKTPPYNHCSLCHKWLGFWEYLQFWKKNKICKDCDSLL